MIDTDSLQNERGAWPKDKIRRVRQIEILPAVPNEVKWPGKEEKSQKYAVVKRKYTQRSARVKGPEEIRAGYGIEQDAGVGIGPEEVMVQNEQNRKTANAVKSKDMIFRGSSDTGRG